MLGLHWFGASVEQAVGAKVCEWGGGISHMCKRGAGRGRKGVCVGGASAICASEAWSRPWTQRCVSVWGVGVGGHQSCGLKSLGSKSQALRPER